MCRCTMAGTEPDSSHELELRGQSGVLLGPTPASSPWTRWLEAGHQIQILEISLLAGV